MADILIDNEAQPSNPSSSKSLIYVDNTMKRLVHLNDVPYHSTMNLQNASTASVSAGYATDTYLAGSSIVVPAGYWQAGTLYYCEFDMTKTAAGTAQAILTLRMGTAGTTADASIASQTYTAGTGAADTGFWQVWALFRSVGSGTSAVIQLNTLINKTLTSTGLINSTNITLMTLTTSSGFNSTTQTTIGLSFNGGSAFSGTNTFVISQLSGI